MSDKAMKREKRKAEKARKSEKIKKAKNVRKKDEKDAKKIRKEEEERSARKDRSIEEKIQREIEEMEKKDKEEEDRQQRQKEEEERESRKKEESEWIHKVETASAKMKEENPISIPNEENLKRDGYDINRVDVATGRTGKIYKAKDKDGIELYAKLIILRNLKQKMQEKLKESLKVVKYLKSNSHPNVIKIYDVYTTKEKVYIFMEMTNGAFKSAIKANSSDESTVKKWAQNIADAILFLHANGIAHQNILPENVLVDKEGNLKLAGLSYACITYDPIGKTFNKQSPTGEYFSHFSPERIKDKYDPIKADIFSFGVLIIYFLIRTFPFHLSGSDKSKYPMNVQWKLSLALKKVQISRELKDLLTLLFEPDPEKRPHMREVIKKPWMTGDFTPVAPPTSAAGETPSNSKTASPESTPQTESRESPSPTNTPSPNEPPSSTPKDSPTPPDSPTSPSPEDGSGSGSAGDGEAPPAES